MNQTENNEKKSKEYVASGISAGLCIGVACGLIFDNLALGVGIGLCFGSILGAVTQKNQDKN